MVDKIEHYIKSNPHSSFVLYGNLEEILKLELDIEWVIPSRAKIGGITPDFYYGHTTVNNCDINVIISEKYNSRHGVYLMPIDLKEDKNEVYN